MSETTDLIGQLATQYAQVEIAKVNSGLSGTTSQQQAGLNSVPVPSQPQAQVVATPSLDLSWIYGGVALALLVVVLALKRG